MPVRRSRITALVLALIVFAFYAQTGAYEFLRFDDHDYTFLCPFVKDGLSWANVKTAFTTFTHAAIWMPLTYISYMLDISLFGPGMGAHHLVNAAIHAANTALFYLLLTGIFSPLRVADNAPCQCDNRQPTTDIRHHPPPITLLSAIPATLFWAFHPMRVEPVAWIAGRKELLCAFWVLLGLIAVVKLMRRCSYENNCGLKAGKPESIQHSAFNISTVLCCLFACMCKPTGMCFPFLALCVAAMVRQWRHSESKVKSIQHPTSQHFNISTFQLFNLSTFILTLPIAVITGLIAVYSQTHAAGYDVRALFTAPFYVRALNALKSLGLYIFKTFIPFDLHIDCRWPTPDLPVDGWGVVLVAIVGLILLVAWFAKGIASMRFPPPRRVADNAPYRDDNRQSTADFHQLPIHQLPLATIFFFLFALAPTLGVFGNFGREARADRFMYIPSMAISILIVAAALWRRVADNAPYQCCNRESKVEKSDAASQKPQETTSQPFNLSTFQLFNLSTSQPFNFSTSLLLALLLCQSIYSLRLIPTFRNDYTAFSRVIACDPIHPRALSHVASEECARFHDFDSGIRHFRDSLACEWNRDTACQLAFALAIRGRREDVADIRALGESTGIAKNPETDRSGLMCEALGMSAVKEHRWLDAVPFFAAAVRAPARLNPPDDAYARLGVALANGGRRKEAEQVFAALARPGAVRESVRAFAERSLEQLASSKDGGIMLFY